MSEPTSTPNAKPPDPLLIPRILSFISLGSSVVAFVLLSGAITIADPGFKTFTTVLSIILPTDAILLSGVALLFISRLQNATHMRDVQGLEAERIHRTKRLVRLALVFAIAAVATLLHGIFYEGLMEVF